MSRSVAAERFARALLEAAADGNALAEVTADMEILAQCLRDGQAVFTALTSPALSRAERMRICREVFEGRVHPITFRFLGVLFKRGRQNLLGDIPAAFRELADGRNRVSRGKVTSAWPLGDVERRMLVERIERRIGRRCELEFAVDKSLGAGLRIMIDHERIDCSAAGGLARLRQSLAYEQVIPAAIAG